MRLQLSIWCFALLIFGACNNEENQPVVMEEGMEEEKNKEETEIILDSLGAKVLSVEISGEELNYTFSVEIASPDTGCDQYADWWEVFTPDSLLLYRRILAHSHVNEQPFKRSGGPIEIDSETQVFIRAHMNNLGYGQEIFSGSITEGFSKDTIGSNYAIRLEEMAPLPTNCAF